MKILFVCTGNTCRSVLAHYYAAKLAPHFGRLGKSAGLAADEFMPLEFFSAGLAAEKDISQPPIIKKLLQKEGVKDFSHTPERLTAEMAGSAGLILAMTHAHKELVIQLFPEAAPKTRTLLEYAGFGAEDISDPYGRDDLFYFETFKLIKTAVKAALEKLKKNVK